MTDKQLDVDVLDEMIQEESTGGGYIGRITFAAAWKVFISGLSNVDSTFLVTGKADKGTQLGKAKAVLAEHGAGDAKPQFCLVHILHKDDVLNYENASNWQGDRYYIEPTWTSAGKLVNEKRKALGLAVGETFWGQMASQDDPYRDASGEPKMETVRGADGEDVKRPRRFTFAVLKFASKEEAMKAAGESGGDPNVPPGYKAGAWALVKPEIVKVYSANVEKLKGEGSSEAAAKAAALASAATTFEVEARFVEMALEKVPF